ncbi:MAG TPA: hypothetical protein VFQ05_15520 [Candidatus Eisenbacteria bacterium]|nr:hypothetical protein [Candidatus Eisenbacteria bacterium]
MHRQGHSNRRCALSATVGLLLPLLAGCGSNGGGGKNQPTAPTLPTSQAGTLVVVASVVSNADPSRNFSTDFTVSLADTGSGLAASGATVEFSTPSGTVSLSEDSSTPGTYRAQRSGHAGGLYVLAVARGSDVASGSMDMPDAHNIISPSAGDTLSSNGHLDVSWTRAVAAQEAWIDSKDWTVGPVLDDGVDKIAKGHNDARNDQVVGVMRRNAVSPSGMAAGSSMSASVRVSVGPFVVQ